MTSRGTLQSSLRVTLGEILGRVSAKDADALERQEYWSDRALRLTGSNTARAQAEESAADRALRRAGVTWCGRVDVPIPDHGPGSFTRCDVWGPYPTRYRCRPLKSYRCPREPR